MTKRRNPYFDDFEPQIKVHIGLKQFNNNNNENMKSIYNKTVDLLFRGAKQDESKESLKKVSEVVSNGMEHSGKKHMKQMTLGRDGILQKDGYVDIMDAHMKDVPCAVCSMQLADIWESCRSCDQPQCSGCSLKCVQCSTVTCANCSFPNYNMEGGVFCLSCSS